MRPIIVSSRLTIDQIFIDHVLDIWDICCRKQNKLDNDQNLTLRTPLLLVSVTVLRRGNRRACSLKLCAHKHACFAALLTGGLRLASIAPHARAGCACVIPHTFTPTWADVYDHAARPVRCPHRIGKMCLESRLQTERTCAQCHAVTTDRVCSQAFCLGGRHRLRGAR